MRKAQIQLVNIIAASMIAITVVANSASSFAFENSVPPLLVNYKTIRATASSPPSGQHEQPVFRYAVSSGVRGAQKPIDKLLIFNNGNVLVTGDVGVPDREAKLSEDDLKKFKFFLLQKNEFFNLNSVEIEKRLNQNGATGVIDGNSCIFSSNFDGKLHEVEIYSLWAATKSFPNFDEIKKCGAIEKRCKAIISLVNLGDRGPEVLKTVNDEIEDRNLGIQPFKIDEMRLSSQLAGGRFQVSFVRAYPGKPGESQQEMHAIYFIKHTGTAPKISFYNLPKE